MIIIVFLTLYIDPLSSKTTKMIIFLTQYLQSLGQKESLHEWLVGKQSAFLHV